MAIRNQTKLSTSLMAPDMSLEVNPYTQNVGSARVLRNFTPERSRMVRKAHSPKWNSNNSEGSVWHARDFRYTRAGAPENKIMILRADGKLYSNASGWENQIFPVESGAVVSGPLADAAASDSGASWVNPTNVATSNDTRASATLTWVGSPINSSTLLIDNLGFSIPAGNVIHGIKVNVEGYFSTASTSFVRVIPYKGGAVAGTSKDQVMDGPATASSGIKSAGTGTSAAGTHTAWTNPGNITASDDSRATAVLAGSTSSNALQATNFGFAVPSTAVINGIIAEFEVSRSAGFIYDSEILILKGGVTAGTSKASGTLWPTTDAYSVYGNSTDKWGTTWTPADVNAANFGVQLKAINTGSVSGTAQVDHVRITVHYTDSSDKTYALGDSTDLWGASWTDADINSTGFGFGIAYYVDLGGGGGPTDYTCYLDYVSVTVYHGTGFSTLFTKKPFARQLSNRFFVSDGVGSYVYDGRNPIQPSGLARSTTAPAVTAQNLAGSIVAATGVKGCFSWVVLDENGARVHESSRSNINASFVVVGGVDDSVRLDITGITPPARATHWSAYISELDGSEVYRRVATTPVATLTVDVTAFPASTSPKAPIRNDPPPPSTVGCVAKNRIFLRDDANPNTFYFSALGEVKGLLNGAPEESFCGYGINSISDIVNSDFISDREIRAMVEHEGTVFMFGERQCYAYIGEFNLLDNRSPRNLLKVGMFPDNCAGADAAVSTPYGLVWMNSGRRISLWSGGQEVMDAGLPIQPILDTITKAEEVYMSWWSGNGRQWLIVNCKASAPDDSSGAAESYRSLILDFSRPSQGKDGRSFPGSWFEWTDVAATAACSYYDDQGNPFLLLGSSNGELRLADRLCSPSHLGTSAVLGSTYLGATVQNNPKAVYRSGLFMPIEDGWTCGDYLQLQTGTQDGSGVPALGSLAEPAITYRVDIENPNQLGTGISLALDNVLTSGDKRAWLVPETVGNTNIGGAFGKQFCFHFEYTEGSDTTGETDGRYTARLNAIYKIGFTFSPQKEMSR